MTLRKILSLYEIIFGFLGVGMVFYVLGPILINLPSSSFGAVFTLFVIALLFYVLAIFAGISLFGGHTIGKNLSVVLHILQIPIFTIAGVKYFIALGAPFVVYISLGERSAGAAFNFFFGNQFEFSTDASGTMLGANITALIVLILLLRIRPNNPTQYTPGS